MSKARITYSVADVQRCATNVLREMCALGLLHKKLADTQVITVNTDIALKGAYGMYVTESHPWFRFRGYPKGSIVVPLVSLQAIIDRLKHQRASLVDTLRHEFGHAFAYTSGRCVRKSKNFMQAFGAEHDRDARAMYRADCLNMTAMENPAEDFAECFAAYLRYGGDIDRFKKRPHVYKKMRFVRSLRADVQKSGDRIIGLEKGYKAPVSEA